MNRSRGLATAVALVVIATAATACEKSNAEAKAEQASPAEAKAEQTSTAEAKGPQSEAPVAESKVAADARAALTSYESLRASLAKDAVAATTGEAASLEKSARSASTAASGDANQKWSQVADAAKRLHDMPKDNADAVRKAFGEVSQHLLAILAADRSLAEGLHVFECPMAQGYKKWAQPAAKISNPYMGTRMPSCGSASDWAVDGQRLP